jgi:hypothetical protein
VRIVARGPDPAVDAVVRWRLMSLAAWVWEAFAISISEATLSREPKALGSSKIPARPRHHDQNPDAADASEKTSPPARRRSGHAFQPGPEQSFGSRTKRGPVQRTRSPAPLRTAVRKSAGQWVGAARNTAVHAPRPAHPVRLHIRRDLSGRRQGAGLVMPHCDSDAMSAHLAGISAMVAPGAHAVVVLDQAGWHTSGALTIPENVTLMPLPPRPPELNPTSGM